MGQEETHNDSGLYDTLRAPDASLTIRPLYFYVTRLQKTARGDDVPAKALAKQLILHTTQYDDLVNPDREATKLARNDEPIFLVAGLERLVRNMSFSGDTRAAEQALLTPPKAGELLTSAESISMFKDYLTALYSAHPEFMTSNDRLRDLGHSVIHALNTVHSTQRTPAPVVVHPYEVTRFNEPVFRYVRLEMRRVRDTIEELT